MGSGPSFSPSISWLHFLGSVIRLVDTGVVASISQYYIILYQILYYVLPARRREGKNFSFPEVWQNILFCLIGCDWGTSFSHYDGQSNVMY